MAWIKTRVYGDIVLQKKNRLKGLALQGFVSKLIKKKYDAKDLMGEEDSITQISEEADKILSKMFNAKSTFRLADSEGKIQNFYPKQSDQFDVENYLVNLNDFEPPIDLYVKKGAKNSSLGYKGCRKCNYCVPQKFCKNCGGAYFEDRFRVLRKIGKDYDSEEAAECFDVYSDSVIPPSKEDRFLYNIKWIKEAPWNKGSIDIDAGSWGYQEWCTCDSAVIESHAHGERTKCPNCRSSSFKLLRPGFNFNEFVKKEGFENLSIAQLSELLVDEELVTASSSNDSLSKKRLDSWLVSEDGNELFIIETKNYEDTNLTIGDFYQVLGYIKAVRESGIAKPKAADIIYNGASSDDLKKYIEAFSSSIEAEVEPIQVKEFCKGIEIWPKQIIISKDLDEPKLEFGEFKLDFSLSNEPVENPKLQIQLEEEKNSS